MRKLRFLLLLAFLAVAGTFMPVTVNAAVKPKLNVTKVTLPVKTDGYYNHMYLWLKGTKKSVKWSTSNKKIVTVGKMTGNKDCVSITTKKKGKAIITAKVGKKNYKCKVTVTKAMNTSKLNKLVSVDTSTVKEQYVTFKNKSKKYYLTAYWDFSLYNEQGQSVDSDEVFMHLKPGESARVAIRNPQQYPKLKFTKKKTFIDYEYHPIKSSLVKKAVTVDNKLPVVVTNKSKYKESILYVTVFFKKNGRIVWTLQKDTDGATGKNFNPGQSRTINYWLGAVEADYNSVSIQVSRSSGSAYGGSND